MNEKINNYRPEIKSLCQRLIRDGFTLVSGHNGEDRFKYDGDLDEFVANLEACDEAHLYVRPAVGITVPENAPANTLCIFLVLGNEPGVIASDYTNHPQLDASINAHYEKWENRAQPTSTWAILREEDSRRAAARQRRQLEQAKPGDLKPSGDSRF